MTRSFTAIELMLPRTESYGTSVVTGKGLAFFILIQWSKSDQIKML